MDKIVGEFDICDECEGLVDVYVEFHSRRGAFVKVCMNCLANAITSKSRRNVISVEDKKNVEGKFCDCKKPVTGAGRCLLCGRFIKSESV